MNKKFDSKSNKLCFMCDKFIKDDSKRSIGSIILTWAKFSIMESLKKFKSNKLITNIEDYDLNCIHNSCYRRRKENLEKS